MIRGDKLAHSVTCTICKERFDRDLIEYCITGARRYAHAACMLREAQKDPNYKKLEIIDPLDDVVCKFCKNHMSRKKDPSCIMISEGVYAHKGCLELEQARELTDKEKLDEYIKKLFNMEYVSPHAQRQIKQYAKEYNFTYSGMLKALQYFYEIKGNSIDKANGGVGIIPHVYQNAYNYYYNLWLAQQKNESIDVSKYVPKVKEIVIPPPQLRVKKRKLFSFLDEEEGK